MEHFQCKTCKIKYHGQQNFFYAVGTKKDGTKSYSRECISCVKNKRKKVKKDKEAQEAHINHSSDSEESELCDNQLNNKETNPVVKHNSSSLSNKQNETKTFSFQENVSQEDTELLEEKVLYLMNKYKRVENFKLENLENSFYIRIESMRTDVSNFIELENKKNKEQQDKLKKKIQEQQDTIDQYGKIISFLVKKLNIDEDEIDNILYGEEEDDEEA